MDREPGYVPCGEDEFYWNLAYSENDSTSRHGDAWRQALGAQLSATIASGDRTALREPDWSGLRHAFHVARGGYLEPLLTLGVSWHLGELDTRRLGEVRLIRLEAFRAVAPSLLLAEFVQALDCGQDTPENLFAARYRRLRPRFDPNRSLGRPILIGPGIGGPFTEVDGLTRLSILLSRRTAGEAVPSRIGILLGVSNRLREWSLY